MSNTKLIAGLTPQEYHAAWRKANPESLKRAKQKYRETHPERVKAQEASRYWDNPEKARARSRAYHAAHPEAQSKRQKAAPERCREYSAKWRGKNRDRIAEYAAARQKANPDKCRAGTARRRAAKLQATPAWADHVEINAVYAKAALLGLAVDHIVPLRGKLVCGLHVHHNLQPLSGPENSRKSNRHTP